MSAPVSGSLESHFVIGEIAGVYGVKGWVKVKSFTQPADNILKYLPWQVKAGEELRDLDVDAHQLRSQGLLIHVRGIDDRDGASGLVRELLYAPTDALPELSADEFYWQQLLGLVVISVYGGREIPLGKVASLFETGANDVLVVQGDNGSIDKSERLIPYVPGQFVQRIDLDAGIIWVDWDPEF